MNAEKADDPCGVSMEPYGAADITAGHCLHMFHAAYLEAWQAKEDSQKLCLYVETHSMALLTHEPIFMYFRQFRTVEQVKTSKWRSNS